MEKKSTHTPLWQIAALGAVALGFIVWLDLTSPGSGDVPVALEQASMVEATDRDNISHSVKSGSELPVAASVVVSEPSIASAPPPTNPYDRSVLGEQLERIVGTDPENQAQQLSEFRSLSSQLYLEHVAASSGGQQDQADSESDQNLAPEDLQSESAAAQDTARTNPYAELQAKVPNLSDEELRQQRALRGSAYLELTRPPQPEVGGR